MRNFIKGICVGIIGTSILSFGIYSFADSILKNISVAENSVTIKVNNKSLTAPNFIYNGRTYVQVKDLTDALGQKLNWDANSKTVLVGKNDISSNNNIKIIKDEFTTNEGNLYHIISFSDEFIVTMQCPKEKVNNMDAVAFCIRITDTNNYDNSKVKIYGYDENLNKVYDNTYLNPSINRSFFDQLNKRTNNNIISGYVTFNEKIDGIIFDDGIHKCKLSFEQK